MIPRVARAAGVAVGVMLVAPVAVLLSQVGSCWLRGAAAPKREAVVSRFSRQVSGTLTPEILAYTRRVTLMWGLFFVGQIVVSAVLFLFASREVWLLFINVLNLPLILLLFGCEHFYGRWRNPYLVHQRVGATWRMLTSLRAAAGRNGG